MQEALVMQVEELANHFGVGTKAVYKWIKTGWLPERCVLRNGRRIYLKRAEVERWLSGA
ncbi:helix-turn-helix domain-containing protein [Microbacterium sp.]|uniref:helix-turn-helix domain-containing protein n=1 Tax=Microbacterium sp. TaxID=51671 RepID=UPI00260ED8C2|nr:helix-turn-helix domain-containing protein [Microbacterium sp.]